MIIFYTINLRLAKCNEYRTCVKLYNHPQKRNWSFPMSKAFVQLKYEKVKQKIRD